MLSGLLFPWKGRPHDFLRTNLGSLNLMDIVIFIRNVTD